MGSTGKSTTDPALLVKGRRYAIRDLNHPEYAKSVGVFDEVRPSQWTGENSVYFIDGQIGGVAQSIFGHPTTKRCEYAEVEFRADDPDPLPPVEAGVTAAAVAESDTPIPDHDCMENAVPYVSDGPLGHGWECGICGEFLQAG